MTRISAFIAALCLTILAACGTPSPTAGVSVGPGGATGAVGVESGRVNAGVTTSGNAYVSADVIQTDSVDVSVGTGGVGVSVGSGPVQVGFGRGGWGLHI